MPHLIVEHSYDISSEPITQLQQDIQVIMSQSEGNFTIEACKTRAFVFGDYRVGALNQDESSFIHITLKILQGRTLEARKALSDKIMTYLDQFVANQNLTTKRCDISVDIVEMDKETYGKARIGE